MIGGEGGEKREGRCRSEKRDPHSCPQQRGINCGPGKEKGKSHCAARNRIKGHNRSQNKRRSDIKMGKKET